MWQISLKYIPHLHVCVTTMAYKHCNEVYNIHKRKHWYKMILLMTKSEPELGTHETSDELFKKRNYIQLGRTWLKHTKITSYLILPFILTFQGIRTCKCTFGQSMNSQMSTVIKQKISSKWHALTSQSTRVRRQPGWGALVQLYGTC